MPEQIKLRLVTIALVFAACAIAFLFWKDNAPLLAGLALLGAVAAEVTFWVRVWQQGR